MGEENGVDVQEEEEEEEHKGTQRNYRQQQPIWASRGCLCATLNTNLQQSRIKELVKYRGRDEEVEYSMLLKLAYF